MIKLLIIAVYKNQGSIEEWKINRFLPCSSSNCRSPCDCTNTDSVECGSRDRAVGSILPTPAAQSAAVGAVVHADIDGDDDDVDGVVDVNVGVEVADDPADNESYGAPWLSPNKT